jgi:adenine/guanine phosphoribosyltransferase-like PRPP-binding protein
MPEAFFTETTAAYWQEITRYVPSRFAAVPPFRFGYPARLPDEGVLVLPLRQLPAGNTAVASLIANQASHEVIAVLADHMTTQARSFRANLLIGLPTLGLAFASLVAARLGHSRYVPLGYSRKFWYDDGLSEPVNSITSPEAGKFLRLDPNLLLLIEGRRVALVDDAISTGATTVAAVQLLQKIGAEVVGVIVAMKQTRRWEPALHVLSASPSIRAVFGCPLFRRGKGGWWPLEDTQPLIP